MKLAHPKPSEKLYIGKYLVVATLSPDARYEIDAFVDGRVLFLPKPFMKVAKGQKIVQLDSPSVLEIHGRYVEALLQLRYFKREIQRIKPLVKERIVAKRELLHLQNQAKLYLAKSGYFKQLLSSYGVTPKTLKPLSKVSILSPIDGVVERIGVSLGDFVKKGDPILSIVDPNKVLLQIDLPLKIANTLDKTLTIGNIEAKIVAISPVVDAKTQTLRILAKASLGLKPNESRQFPLYLKKRIYKLPKSALVEGKIVVKKGEEFLPRDVKVLGEDERWIYVDAKGLNPQDQVVVEGAMRLIGEDDD